MADLPSDRGSVGHDVERGSSRSLLGFVQVDSGRDGHLSREAVYSQSDRDYYR